MTEIFKPINLYCDTGKTTATIHIPAEENLRDGIGGYVMTPCNGCQHWSLEGIKNVEQQLKAEWGDKSGITEGRANQLKALVVDKSRFVGGDSELVIAMCSPIGCD